MTQASTTTVDMIVGGLDLETTGLEQEKGHRIVEFAILLYLLDETTGKHSFKGKYVQRINPQRPIDPGAYAVHGISYEDVSMCPTWDEVAPKVVKLMGACDVVVAHNGDGFDLPFIAAELLRIGQPIPDVESVDTMLQGRWATPNGKMPNLGEFCFATGVSYDKEMAHAAEYDVQVMLEGFFLAHREGFIKLPSTCRNERRTA